MTEQIVAKEQKFENDCSYWCAYWLVRHALRDVVDKHGQPISRHCERVARLCLLAGLSSEQQLAGMLHDVLEDSQGRVTRQTLYGLFGPKVTGLVVELTRARGAETYAEYICRLSDPAAEIKLCDLTDNMDERRGPQTDKLKSLHAKYAKAKKLLTLRSEIQKCETDAAFEPSSPPRRD